MASRTSKILSSHKLQVNCERFYNANLKSKMWHPLVKWFKSDQSNSSTKFPIIDTKEILLDEMVSYKVIVKALDRQAKNSVLLKVDAPPDVDQSYLNLRMQDFVNKISPYNYLSKTSGVSNSKGIYYLVEFPDSKGVEALAQESQEGPPLRVVQLKSTSNFDKVPRQKQDSCDVDKTSLSEQELISCANMSEQMNLMYTRLSPSSHNLREKFFVNSIVDEYFTWLMAEQNINKNFAALPFGTVMTGFGTFNSDIDISLTEMSYGDGHSIRSLRDVTLNQAMDYKQNHRNSALNLFQICHEKLPKFLPNMSEVSVVPASVPLLSFTFDPLNVFAEISLNNRSAVQMSWCINMYSRMDKRVAPFIFFVREWAKQNGITEHGGATYQGLTPFMVTSLALFHLMRVNPPVIPPIRRLIKTKPDNSDWVLGGFRTKLTQDIQKRKCECNTMSLEELFLSFLQYYHRINFARTSFSLAMAQVEVNNRRLLNIRSPLHAYDGNIGKNCDLKELKKFQRKIEILLRRLDDRQLKHSGYKHWGILSTMDIKKLPYIRKDN